MSITGHRTASMFLRYDITSTDDQRDALRRTQAHVKAQPAEPTSCRWSLPVAHDGRTEHFSRLCGGHRYVV